MVYVLFAAIAAGAAIGGARSFAGAPAPTPIAEDARQAAVADEGTAPGTEPGDEAAAVEGEVLEVIDVPKYSYLRIGAKGSEGTWIAVPTATVKVGDHARLEGGMKMTSFASTALKRTFPVIYFGSLQGKRAQGMDPSAAAMGRANGAGPHATGAVDPHAQQQGGAVDVKLVEKAKGADGRTVAEVLGQRATLSGKTVRIHGTVVKSTPGILGKTYLHVRDGSGDASAGTNDITVTTTTTPAVGDVVLIEGTVVLDRDIGAGYKFPTLVEDAKVLPQ
jgi:hypothetical protein